MFILLIKSIYASISPSDCNKPVGIGDGTLSDSAMTANSEINKLVKSLIETLKGELDCHISPLLLIEKL